MASRVLLEDDEMVIKKAAYAKLTEAAVKPQVAKPAAPVAKPAVNKPSTRPYGGGKK